MSLFNSARWMALVLAASLSDPRACFGQTWVAVGPGPSYGGQVEGITNREVVGAVNAIAAHPSDPDILYIGAVNGGIWRSNNATNTSPSWLRLSDTLPSLSIASLELDPTDSNSLTVLAGVARNSSYGGNGGALIGMLRSTDGGTTWAVLTGGVLSGRSVFGVAGRGATLIVATDQGIYRSSNNGTLFTKVSGAVGSGIPAGSTPDLSADPSNMTRLYTAVLSGNGRGIYRSIDTGSTWSKVSDSAIDATMTAGNSGSRRTEITVGSDGQVFLAVVDSNGRLAQVFRSSDGATDWTALGIPTTSEQNGVLFGAHPGGQGGTHLSIVADPIDANVVYVGGDRQPYFGEGVSGSNQFFPNSSGANDYSGRLFRGDASQPVASVWSRLTHSGAANNSAPHADSRDMAFDAAGNLLESDDGGIYKRLSPRSATGAWLSLNGDLQTTEYHGIAYDSVANRVIGGAQDTGTTEQRDTTTRIFNSVSTGDGGDPAVEDRASSTSSTRYSSFQFLQSLRRRTFNSANVVTSTAFPARTLLDGSPALQAQFYTPLAVNYASGTRLLIGATNGVYESMDRGDTITRISALRINSGRGGAVEYGVLGDPTFILLGSDDKLYLRSAGATSLDLIYTLPGTISDVAVDPDLASRIFAITSTSVQYSTNLGSALTAITGNLVSEFNPGTLRTMAFVSGPVDQLVVAADRGVYVSDADSGFISWSRLGIGLPNAVVFELEYDRIDDVLIAGTLGRGAWRLSPVSATTILFSNGFE